MKQSEPQAQKTLALGQTWYLGVSALAVILMFAFVILPYVDPKKQSGAIAGELAQDFDLELLSGGAAGDRIRLSDLRGKPAILDFWASWCKPCREQATVLEAAYAKLKDRAHVLGISTSDQRDDAVGYLKQAKPSYSNVFDTDGLVGRAYQVAELPTLIVVDAKGQIRGRYNHIADAQQVIDIVGKLEE